MKKLKCKLDIYFQIKLIIMNQQTLLYSLNPWLIDCGGIIKQFVNYVFHHSYFSRLRRNRELVKDENAEKKCYVCALGPSLKGIDLYKIQGDTIVVNRFFKIGSDFPNFIPTYYILLDPTFDKPQNSQDFKTALDSYIDKGTIYILNAKLASSPIMSEYKNNKNIYYISCFKGSMHPDEEYKIDRPIPAFQNVVGAAILMVALMNYKDISLLGCDFNSFASTKNKHCYQEKNETRIRKLSLELFCYYLAAKNHDDLYEYSIRNNISIFNATKGSLIDSYPFNNL